MDLAFGIRGRRRDLHPAAAAVALVAIVVAAYAPALRAGFVWDDNDHVTENPTLRSLDGLRRIWFDLGAVPQYYPLVHTTFWIEHRLWGLDPTGYHATNVVLHGLNAVLLWRLLRRLGISGAWIAAAVFAVHPVHVESVAWVTERKNVLSAAFYLGAAHAWLRFRPLDEDARPGGIRSFGLALVLFVGALLSKSVTATFPAAMLLLVWWKRGRITLRDVAPTVPLFALGAGMGVVTAWMERHHVGATGKAWDLSLAERCLVAGRAVWFYAGKLVWPHPLAFIYPRFEIDPTALRPWTFPLTAAAVPCALFTLRARLGRAPLAAVLFFGGTLLPALGFVNVYPMRYSFVADHFQYLASLGLLVPAVAFAAWGLERFGAARILAGTLALGVLAALTFRQSAVYAHPEILWRDTLAKNPTAFMAHNNLGALLLARGDRTAARLQFEEAIRDAPDAPEAYDNLGIVLHQESRYDEAIASYLKALETDPTFAEAHSNLGITLATVGRTDDAIDHFEAALRRRPSFVKARYNLGVVLLGVGRAQDAWVELAEAARLDPGDADIRRALAEAARRRES